MYLTSHFKNIHLGQRIKCDVCSKEFSLKSSLATHKKIVHLKLRKFNCIDCPKVYARKYDLMCHVNAFHNNLKHKCGQCFKEFTGESYLKRHNRIIHGSEKFECDICEKTFTSIEGLKIHSRTIHDKQKIHKCEVCNQCFTTKAYLKNHLVVHKGLQPINVTNVIQSLVFQLIWEGM